MSRLLAPGSNETLDAIFRGRAYVFQHRRGYRFGVDALLLADFLVVRSSDRLLDIGTGHAVIPLALFCTRSFRHVTGVEAQAGLARLAERSVALNDAEKKITVVEADIRSFRVKSRFDAAFANPPYRAIGQGRLSSGRERAVARHELMLTLGELFTAASRLVRRKGRFSLIHLAERERVMDAVSTMRGFRLARERRVLSRKNESPVFLLREYRKTRSSLGVKRFPPLVLFTPRGRYTREARAILEGEKRPSS